MSLIAVEAKITLNDPSARDALVARCTPNQRATRDEEPGCLVYCFAADPCDNGVIQVYELWESEAALAAHFLHPNYHENRAMLINGGLASVVSRKHRIDASAPVYDADHRPTATFD